MLGILGEAQFEMRHIHLLPGDTLVLYTDGVIEAGEEMGAELGERGLERLLRQCGEGASSHMIRSVVSATRRLSPDETYADDFTLMLIRRQAEQAGQVRAAEAGLEPQPRYKRLI